MFVTASGRLSANKGTPLLPLATFIAFLFIFTYREANQSWVPQAVGLGDNTTLAWASAASAAADPAIEPTVPDIDVEEDQEVASPLAKNYSRVLVVPRTSEENTDWITENFPNLETAIYVVDDATAPFHPPRNKGHEVMVYLSYIIDHYEDLPDIMVFMHSHRYGWHNEALLNNDAVMMLQRLNGDRVARYGYMNLRCTWEPGCPNWIHPTATVQNSEKQEEPIIAQAWGEMFPFEPVPDVLAQPCCGQFAVSRQRVLSVPRQRYLHFRDWLLKTELSDYFSGRVWEYVWQLIFTGQNVHCPPPDACYCDGYGICFGGPEETEDYFDLRFEMEEMERQVPRWWKYPPLPAGTNLTTLRPIVGMAHQIREMSAKLDGLLQEAMERGLDTGIRAEAANRPWNTEDYLDQSLV